MTKDELEKATGQELIDARDYCGVDGYYREYLNDVNAEMLKRFERLAKLKKRCDNYEMILSKMEKGICDICKETEKDKKIEELEKENKELKKRIDKVGLDNTTLLKIINCIKFRLCKQDEDYDEPIISPKFLSDILDQMAIDGFEWN
jgi:hypothetical protein